MSYPYRIRVKDSKTLNKLMRLNRDRFVESDQSFSIWAGLNLKPIRHDIFIGTDNTKGNPGIVLKDIDIKLDIKPAFGNKKGWDVFFRRK